jgi:6,7-dimethyl-8-ribityllumazine synthase
MSEPEVREEPRDWPLLEPDEDVPAFQTAKQEPEPAPEPEPEQEPEPDAEAPELEAAPEHAAGRFEVPAGYKVLSGSKGGGGKTVGIVVARFNGEITSRLLQRALDELDEAGTERESVTIVPVPGAFELPLAAIALAKTRKYACIVALGCVIRGETSHFDYVAGEAASGLQLAAIETGVPVAFGVLTTETLEQAEARVDRAADAVRGALEMAGLFQHLRAAAR